MDKSTLLDSLKLLPVYFLFIATFGSASMEKFLSGGAPDWFKNQFAKTPLNIFPGSISLQYYLIAALEAAVVIAFLYSAGSFEFVDGHDKSILKAALLLALFTFFALGFGLRLSGDYQGAANLFAYFGVTFIIFVYVERFANA